VTILPDSSRLRRDWGGIIDAKLPRLASPSTPSFPVCAKHSRGKDKGMVFFIS